MARSLTAGIAVTQLAAEKYPPPPSATPASPTSAPSTPKKRRHYTQHVETEAAVWEDGVVTIKGNPLVRVREIRCPKCGLEKLLHPTAGNGARDPPQIEGKEYCALHPFVDREGYDIYGLPFPKDDVSNSKRKDRAPEKERKNGLQLDGTADSSFESSGPTDSPPPEGKVGERKMVFPNVECPRCPRVVNVRVFARHLNGHLKSGGRASGRAAAARISGTNDEKRTDKESRRTTPALTKDAKAPPQQERSPKKRDRERSDSADERSAKRTSLPESSSSRSELSSASERPKTGGKGNIYGSGKGPIKGLAPGKAPSKAPKKGPSSSSSSISQREREEKEEKDKERRRIMQREMDRQREREIATNKLFMAAKRRWPDKVVKKWKSGKVTVDGKVWEPREGRS